MRKAIMGMVMALSMLFLVSAVSAGTLITLKPYDQTIGVYDVKSVLACVYSATKSNATGVSCSKISTIGGYIDSFTLSRLNGYYCTPVGGLKLMPWAETNADSIFVSGGTTSSRSGCGIVSIQTDGTPLGSTNIAIPAYRGSYLLVSEEASVQVVDE